MTLRRCEDLFTAIVGAAVESRVTSQTVVVSQWVTFRLTNDSFRQGLMSNNTVYA